MIKKLLFFLKEILNFHVVHATHGYLGDMHRAINFAFPSATLMWAIHPALLYQSTRRGISLKELAFSELKKDAEIINRVVGR